ncbi:hypothetical protein ACSSS7_007042 [Eimeria intestinalis]
MPIYKKVTLLGSGSFGKAFLVIEKGGDGTKWGFFVCMRFFRSLEQEFEQQQQLQQQPGCQQQKLRVQQGLEQEQHLQQQQQQRFVLKSIDMSGMDAVAREETLNEAKAQQWAQCLCMPVAYLCLPLSFYLCFPPVLSRHLDFFCSCLPSLVLYPIYHFRLFLSSSSLALGWKARCLFPPFAAAPDLKPQNLFLNARGDLLIGDFGIAKILDSTNSCAKTTIGTPYYFSPELCQQNHYSFPSDVWSLGCIVYELCALAVPFRAQDLKSLTHAAAAAGAAAMAPTARRVGLAENCGSADQRLMPLNVLLVAQQLQQQQQQQLLLLLTVPAVPSVYSAELRQLVTDMLQKDPSRRPTVHQMVALPLIQVSLVLQQQHQ